MNSEIITNEQEFLTEVGKAAKKYTKLVAKTAGPRGHNVMLIEGPINRLTKDGISVLRSIQQVKSAAEKTAIAILRDASEQTNKAAGDGTTATCILANEIFQRGSTLVLSGYNGNTLRKGIAKAATLAEKLIREHLATPINNDNDIHHVAKISSNGSDEIADILTDTFSKIGRNGYARVTTSNTTETSTKIVQGMTFGRGMVSPYFATNDKLESVLENPVILIINKKLSVALELVKPFEALMKMNRPILVIADGYEQDIINTLVVNKLRGLPVCAVEAPSWGIWKTAMMEDIAVVCDGKVISPATGITLKDAVVSPGILGHAKQVVVTSEMTSIVSDTDMNPETNARLRERLNSIDAIINDSSKDEKEKNTARNRKARLVGGIGIISVGGATESEIHEKKDLVDDAFSSVKSSLVYGVVPGGGLTFLCVQDALKSWLEDNPDELGEDEKRGFEIFIESLSQPIMEILKNSMPRDDVSVISNISTIISGNRNLHAKDTTLNAWRFGYNGAEGELGDLVNDGVIDSAAAIISAIKNGSTAGASLLTLAGAVHTEAVAGVNPTEVPM